MKRIWSFVLAAVLLAGMCACNKSTEASWQEQYDLGLRYLSEGKYEEAILAFTAAIEIDPKLAPAYVGLADVYIRQGEYEKALEILRQGLDVTGDAEISAYLTQVQNQSSQLLEPLYAYLEAGDLENAKALMRQEAYLKMCGQIEDGFLYYSPGGGNGLAAYPGNYYYFGQWQDGQRSGHGLWILAVDEPAFEMESYIYDGMWARDLPNGSGEITHTLNRDAIALEEGRSVGYLVEISGNFSDGLYDGEILEVWHMIPEETMIWSPITAVNGVYQAIEYSETGEKTVAREVNTDATLTADDTVHAVMGFEPQ